MEILNLLLVQAAPLPVPGLRLVSILDMLECSQARRIKLCTWNRRLL